MDEIQGTTLIGSIPGVVVGSVVLVQGKLEYAISTNGINQAADFGQHLNKCFHIPDVCGAGSTFSYWLKWRSVSGNGLIMDCGGYYRDALGYAHEIYGNGDMMTYVKSSSTYYLHRASISDPNKWALIVQTWSPSSGIKLYVNGCLVTARVDRYSRTDNVARNLNFVIGRKSGNSRKWVAMEMDNFLAWDDELTEEEVWGLYVQAGQV